MKLNIKDNTMTISTEAVVKSPRKRHLIKTLLNEYGLDEVEQYLKSLNGKYSTSLIRSVRRSFKSQGNDPLVSKGVGYFSKLYDKMFDTGESHKPVGSDSLGQWIGVEIECFIPKTAFPDTEPSARECDCSCECGDSTLNSGCDNCGMTSGDCNESHEDDEAYHFELGRALKNARVKYCSVKSDGSIRCGDKYFAVELTVLFKRSDRANLKKLCKVLNSINAEVNASCGMHVHLDQRDIVKPNNNYSEATLLRRANNLGSCLPMFASMVPKSRRDNQFCELAVGKIQGGRYFAVNLNAFKRYKTIEVRLHSSTTDFVKINNWIDILLLAVSYKGTLKTTIHDVSDFCAEFDVPERLIEYIESRVEKFKGALSRVEEHELPSEEPASTMQREIAGSFLFPENNVVVQDIWVPRHNLSVQCQEDSCQICCPEYSLMPTATTG